MLSSFILNNCIVPSLKFILCKHMDLFKLMNPECIKYISLELTFLSLIIILIGSVLEFNNEERGYLK